MPLFKSGSFTSTSGVVLPFKIDCDALTDDDWTCLSEIVLKVFPYRFNKVYGVPTGGNKLEQLLKQYETPNVLSVLIVDDVWSTGKSMIDFANSLGLIKWNGVVIFNRSYRLPNNVQSIFDLNTFAMGYPQYE